MQLLTERGRAKITKIYSSQKATYRTKHRMSLLLKKKKEEEEKICVDYAYTQLCKEKTLKDKQTILKDY